MIASYKQHILQFKRPSGTSRGILHQKETWFIILEENGKKGIGECGLLRGLSIDDRGDYEEKLQWVCNNINLGLVSLYDSLADFPSIQFGLEQAFLSLESNDPFILFPSDFTLGKNPISINGLVWMGEKKFMRKQIIQKIDAGFKCVKLKIGAIEFQDEINLLNFIRKEFSSDDIEIRVDANGAFSPEDAFDKLNQLSKFELHSIEQPIKQGQLEEMARLCEITPLPIALDEELIGVLDNNQKKEIIETINPQYIILKPSLIGGYSGSQDWIDFAEEHGIGWWVTSALESNIGLNAIAQWTSTLNNGMPQGLGTGGLYTNNFDSPLEVKNGFLHCNPELNWDIKILDN
ncbi:o-succinylbenzoate synthase [Spongiivirga citrea]|uniref:O-succinylbenzoate synthase n=1 Tax=Spongiivirga citrea TaxID=1481457 RepID=A0A6M0CF70_9FLAO|nr:o-succinylbenzoate synthase [Spongiivirga citrea]NER16476.1 o-succinylbenzoate synthase [Spongiivirga citrea]